MSAKRLTAFLRRPLVLVILAILAAGGAGSAWLLSDRGSPAASTAAAPPSRLSCPSSGPDHPIGSVRGSPLLSSVFDGRMCVGITANVQSGGPDPSSASYPAFLASLRARVLKSYIFDTVTGQEARIHGVEATQQQVAAEVAAQQQAAGGASQLDQQLAEAGGSRTTLLDATRSSADEANLVDELARERATDVLTRIRSGSLTFAGAARQFSDDAATRDKGGALGKVALDLLKGADPVFQAAVMQMKPGELGSVPVRDSQGYDILYLEAADSGSRTLDVIRIQAPTPYTAKERPDWFATFVFLDIQGDCDAGQITLLQRDLTSPCAGGSSPPAAPAGTAQP